MRITKERRRDPRHPVSKPAKLCCVQTGRYMAGRTMNISSTGALIEVYRPSLLILGQRLRVGIAWAPRTALIRGREMADATVTRSVGLGGTQRVAVQFDQRQQLAPAA